MLVRAVVLLAAVLLLSLASLVAAAPKPFDVQFSNQTWVARGDLPSNSSSVGVYSVQVRANTRLPFCDGSRDCSGQFLTATVYADGPVALKIEAASEGRPVSGRVPSGPVQSSDAEINCAVHQLRNPEDNITCGYLPLSVTISPCQLRPERWDITVAALRRPDEFGGVFNLSFTIIYSLVSGELPWVDTKNPTPADWRYVELAPNQWAYFYINMESGPGGIDRTETDVFTRFKTVRLGGDPDNEFNLPVLPSNQTDNVTQALSPTQVFVRRNKCPKNTCPLKKAAHLHGVEDCKYDVRRNGQSKANFTNIDSWSTISGYYFLAMVGEERTGSKFFVRVGAASQLSLARSAVVLATALLVLFGLVL